MYRVVLTQFVEALSSLGDLPGAPLQLTLQSLAQVQDANDPSQEVTGHLGRRGNRRSELTCDQRLDQVWANYSPGAIFDPLSFFNLAHRI